MNSTTKHRHFFQPYLLWLALAAVMATVASSVSAQVLHRTPTAAEVAAWVARAELEAREAAIEARAKHASTRARTSRERLFRIRRRLVKLDHRVEGWENEFSGLERRIRDLKNSPRVRNTTQKRRLGSLIADVRRKIAQREGWIAAARREQGKLVAEREAKIEVIAEAKRLLEWRKRR